MSNIVGAVEGEVGVRTMDQTSYRQPIVDKWLIIAACIFLLSWGLTALPAEQTNNHLLLNQEVTQ